MTSAHKLNSKISKQAAFTLIELLVVIVIASIILTFAIVSFGDFGSDKKIRFSAKQLQHLMQLAKQQALLENATYAVKINKHHYQFLKYSDNNWQIMARTKPFTPHQFPTYSSVKLLSNSTQNLVIIHSSGEISPFKLSFYNRNHSAVTHLNLSSDGQLKLVENQP